MTDRLITANAREVTGAEFFDRIFGLPPRDRAEEAQYLRVVNAHWDAAKAESDAMMKRGGESELAFLIRKLAPIYAHEAWVREQGRLRHAGQWKAPEVDERKAA